MPRPVRTKRPAHPPLGVPGSTTRGSRRVELPRLAPAAGSRNRRARATLPSGRPVTPGKRSRTAVRAVICVTGTKPAKMVKLTFSDPASRQVDRDSDSGVSAVRTPLSRSLSRIRNLTLICAPLGDCASSPGRVDLAERLFPAGRAARFRMTRKLVRGPRSALLQVARMPQPDLRRWPWFVPRPRPASFPLLFPNPGLPSSPAHRALSLPARHPRCRRGAAAS
jgi:hypothetical protein